LFFQFISVYFKVACILAWS